MNHWHDTVYLVVAIAGLTVVTIAARAGFLVLPDRFTLHPAMERALRYAPACALAAIIAQGVFTKHGHADISVNNDRMWGLFSGALVYATTRNMLATMSIGMAVFTALRLWA